MLVDSSRGAIGRSPGIYGARDDNAWLAKIACGRLGSGPTECWCWLENHWLGLWVTTPDAFG
jgi:hypothetical protein